MKAHPRETAQTRCLALARNFLEDPAQAQACLREALAQAAEAGVSLTDDCAAVERLGRPVHLTRGSEENLKITTPRDLTWGQAILAERMGR